MTTRIDNTLEFPSDTFWILRYEMALQTVMLLYHNITRSESDDGAIITAKFYNLPDDGDKIMDFMLHTMNNTMPNS